MGHPRPGPLRTTGRPVPFPPLRGPAAPHSSCSAPGDTLRGPLSLWPPLPNPVTALFVLHLRQRPPPPRHRGLSPTAQSRSEAHTDLLGPRSELVLRTLVLCKPLLLPLQGAAAWRPPLFQVANPEKSPSSRLEPHKWPNPSLVCCGDLISGPLTKMLPQAPPLATKHQLVLDWTKAFGSHPRQLPFVHRLGGPAYMPPLPQQGPAQASAHQTGLSHPQRAHSLT